MVVLTNSFLNASNGSGDAALAHVQSTRVIGSTSIAVDTVANWPNYFIATSGTLLSSGFIDPTSKTDFYGHINGDTLIIDGFAPGNSDIGNTANQVVCIKPNTEWANMIASGVQNQTLFPYQFSNFVEPQGALWTQSSGLAGVQTSGYVWYQGNRYSIPAIATHTFAGTQDTYVDVNPVTGVYTYVPVANNASEPAVTTSSVRVAKIVTSSSAITTITQTEYNKPITSSNIASGLNSSLLYNPYKFRVDLTTNLTPGVSTVVFNDKQFDSSNNYSTSTGAFTVPVSGFYFLHASLNFRTTKASVAVACSLWKNGTATGFLLDSSLHVVMFANSYWDSPSCGGIYQLAIGDIITVNDNSGSGFALETNMATNFSGFLVSAT